MSGSTYSLQRTPVIHTWRGEGLVCPIDPERYASGRFSQNPKLDWSMHSGWTNMEQECDNLDRNPGSK